MAATDALLDAIRDEAHLEDLMSLPSEAVKAALAGVDGPIAFLGVGGKMGPTIARMAKRAAPDRRIIGVARFSEPGLREKLESWGIETVACDLLDAEAVARLEKVENVVFMAGHKFGAVENPSFTWAMNALVPAIVAEAFKGSRIAVFSTACVYPFVSVLGGGADEGLALEPPGEYANSCVGRERMFQHFSKVHGTPVSIIRLSYAIDMRYGVLHDVASAVRDGRPVPLANGHCNVIWQGDANAAALMSLAHTASPSFVFNLSGPELVSVRSLAKAFGERLGRDPVLQGEEQMSAWLVNTGLQNRLFGYPSVPLSRLVDWTAEWVSAGRRSLAKPTHFEVRDGTY